MSWEQLFLAISSASFFNKRSPFQVTNASPHSLTLTPGSSLPGSLALPSPLLLPPNTALCAQPFQLPLALFVSSPHPASAKPFSPSSLSYPTPKHHPPFCLLPAPAGTQHSTPDVGADQEGRGWWLLLFWDILSLSGGWSWNQCFHLNQAGGCREAAAVAVSSSSSMSCSLSS